MKCKSINDPRRSMDDAEWADYLAQRRERRAHPRAVRLSGEQVQQIAEICHQAREILFCVNLLIEFPGEWNEQLRAIRSTASTIRYAAKAPRQRSLPPADAVVVTELLGAAADD